MSEKLHQASAEHNRSPENHNSKQEKEHLKELNEKAKSAEHKPKDSIESIKKSIESTAISGKEVSVSELAKKPDSARGVTKELKYDAYKRLLRKTRAHLSAPEKTLSNIIHKPAVEKTSELAAQTVARPAGILFGGIGAFIGTVFVLYISKRNGFSYNYLMFLLMFVGGYIVGTIAEFTYRLVKKP